MIEILLPTYNRAEYFEKNLTHILKRIESENVQDQYRIIISNNCSTDSTSVIIHTIKQNSSVAILDFHQTNNIGLEPNIVFILGKATARHVLFIGDDDFIPEGYLRYIVDTIDSDPACSAILPGILSRRLDGKERVGRPEKFETKKYDPGFLTTLAIGYLGYQMSGILIEREGVLEAYLKKPELRNLHLFNFFVMYNTQRGTAYFAPKYMVAVTTGNKKAWDYDNIGLLGDIYKNFQILFPFENRKRNKLFLQAITKQSWKIGVYRLNWINLKILRNLSKTIPINLHLALLLIGFHFRALMNVLGLKANKSIKRWKRRLGFKNKAETKQDEI